ncbi:cyclin-dependent kinase inhibitor 4-like isoform X1 [Zingiber officinale]|uniref:cyclin-dependent kinase inhibitor 4-like isoform X1 n=1 Tax=Zingiber officinale TaxID=94328 RepID=UPI001C4D02F1|nr:cyclin-dependent kinase inhibitor 4-like isoform X1 [Zingiber officinale]
MTKSQGPGEGKYAKKPDVCGEAKAEGKDASHLPYLGVRTRAQTLALRNLEESSPEATSSYLQLRNRRLEKHSCSPSSARSRAAPKSRLNVCHGPSRQIGGNKVSAKKEFVGLATRFSKKVITEVGSSLETSVGENVLEFDANRSDRETTPCSLIRNSDAIETRGSTTRPTYSTANKLQQLPITSSIPSASEVEMERLFSGPEQIQQRRFMEKYNFDFANDKPLPGRYEWEKLDSSLCRQTKGRL